MLLENTGPGGYFAEVARRGCNRVEGGVVGVVAADDLDERHGGDGVEKVQTKEAFGSAGGHHHICDGERGCVAGKNGVWH